MNSQIIDKAIDLNRVQLNKMFDKALNDMRKQIEKIALAFPSIKNGRVITNDANLNYLQANYQAMLKTMQSSGYLEAVKKSINAEADSIKVIKQAYSTGQFPMRFTNFNNQFLNAFQSNELSFYSGITTKAVDSIHASLLGTVSGGLPIDEALANITKELTDKAARYTKTYLETSRGRLIQLVQDQNAINYKELDMLIYWEYVGPYDKLTRPECRDGLDKKYFTDDEKQSFQAGGGEIPHNEPRYNCRHTFVLISEKTFDKHKVEE